MELEAHSPGTDELEAYTGRYAINEDYIVTISLEAGRLKISHFEGEDYMEQRLPELVLAPQVF